MRGKAAFCGMIVVIISILAGFCPSNAAKLSDNQIQSIQANIHNSTALSSKCWENQNIADQNLSIASSNFPKTNLQGFRQAVELYAQAKSKFMLARKVFDDAWIEMQYGMSNGDLDQVQKGLNFHNTAVQHYNEAVQLVNKAGGVFNQAVQERAKAAQRLTPLLQAEVGEPYRLTGHSTGEYLVFPQPALRRTLSR